MNLTRICLISIVVLFYSTLGLANQSLKFHKNYALLPTSPLLRPVDGITVECWIKAESYYNWGSPVSYVVDNSSNESGFALAFNQGKMRFMLKTENMQSQDWTYNPGVEIEMNQWYHIAGVYDGKSIKFYLNGSLRDERYVTGNIDWTYIPNQLSIGAFVDRNELHNFDGCVDEVRIWNRGLNAEEIKSGMNSTLSGNEDGLLLYLPVTESGSVIRDYSINQFDGRIINYTSENRVPSLAMVQPVVSNSELVSTSSYKIEWGVPFRTEALEAFYIDIARDSKFNSIVTGFSNIKTNKTSYTFTNIPGGDNLFVRIKGKANNGDYTVHSDPFKIIDFSMSLSIDLLSKEANYDDNNHFKILDNNILATSYYIFKKGTSSIVIRSTLSSKLMNQASYGIMHVKGGGIDDDYELGKVSNLVFPELKSGKYEISIKWGPENKGELENRFVIEIDKFWWQNLWLQIIVFITAVVGAFVLSRKFIVLSRKKYNELLNGFIPLPVKDEQVSPEETDKYYNQLIYLMEDEKLYVEPRLNLKMISERLDITSSTLSFVIHEKSGLYFNDFINKYRIEEVKKHLKSKDSANLKIVAIAYKCGFNSESTFFRVFKKYTGETPSSYQSKLRKS